jgi:putative MATE family efflux protein
MSSLSVPNRAPTLPAGLPQTHSLPKQVALLAVWPFLEQLLQFLVGFVDTALAGRLSVDATSAVGVAAYVLWLVGLLNGALGVGAAALLGRAAGAGRWRRTQQFLGQTLFLSLVWGVLIGVLFFLFARQVASFSGLRGAALDYCADYLRILGIVAPFSTVLSTMSACLRASGNTRAPFVAMVLVNAVNIGLSILFVSADAPIGGRGVQGIALGTAIAWICGAALVLWMLRSDGSPLRLRGRFLPPRRAVSLRIVRLAGPNVLENLGHWSGNFIAIALIGRLPEAASMAAHTVAVRIEAISYLPGVAMGVAASTLCAQYIGAQQPQMARRAANWCWLFGVAVMTFMGLLFILIPQLLVRTATNQPVLLESAPQLLFITGFIQAPFASYLVLSSALRGAGDTRWPLFITYVTTYGVRLPLVYLLGLKLGHGIAGVWIALSIELTVRGMLFIARYKFGAWERTRV